MNRACLILSLLVGACSTGQQSEPRYIPYNGYGEHARLVTSDYSVHATPMTRAAATEAYGSVEVSEIAPSLDVFLSAEGDELILLPNRLDKTKLDFSLESLKTVDAWLNDIHKVNELQAAKGRAGEALTTDGRGDNSVVFAGLYLGEVIRANSAIPWRWERFDRFVTANPYFTEHYGFDAGLDIFVLAGPQGVATPINTALKRVLLGREESVHFIGSLLVEPVDLEAAVSGQNFYGLSDIR